MSKNVELLTNDMNCQAEGGMKPTTTVKRSFITRSIAIPQETEETVRVERKDSNKKRDLAEKSYE